MTNKRQAENTKIGNKRKEEYSEQKNTKDRKIERRRRSTTFRKRNNTVRKTVDKKHTDCDIKSSQKQRTTDSLRLVAPMLFDWVIFKLPTN